MIENFISTCWKRFSVRVAEDSLVTGTTPTNCDISHIAFINNILPLLSGYLPDIQRSTWIIAKGELIGQENTSSWSQLRQWKLNWQHWYYLTHRLTSKRILGAIESFAHSHMTNSWETCKREYIISQREIGTIILTNCLIFVGAGS